MAIERDINKKKKKDRDPVQKALPAKPFGRKGLQSPKYTKRNPHRDSGDKKPSNKFKEGRIKDKAKKMEMGQGLARGGMIKGIIRIPPLPAPQPMPRSGTISTIDKGIRKPRPAEKFVKIRERINKLGGYAMGGEASTSLSRAEIAKKNRDRRRKETQEMLERLYGKKKIVPKKKPLKKKDGGDIKDRIQKDMIKRNPQDFDLKTGARLTDKAKMDRIKKARDKAKSKPKRKIF